MTLLTLIRNFALALPDDEDLINELLNVRLRETTPGVYRLDHDPGQHDDQAVALAMGAQFLMTQPSRRAYSIASVPSGPPVVRRGGGLTLIGDRYIDKP